MIIGAGDIAQSLQPLDRPDILFFASGVSNSRCVDDCEFKRECDLFDGIYQANGHNLHRVYFSSLSIYYSDTPYAMHKRFMEQRIGWGKWTYTIIRLGNITWGSNPNTIINYFKKCHKDNVEMQKVSEYYNVRPELQDTFRHLVTRREFDYWISKIRVGHSRIFDICSW